MELPINMRMSPDGRLLMYMNPTFDALYFIQDLRTLERREVPLNEYEDSLQAWFGNSDSIYFIVRRAEHVARILKIIARDSVQRVDTGNYWCRLDSNLLPFPRKVPYRGGGLHGISFSPNGKLLALGVVPERIRLQWPEDTSMANIANNDSISSQTWIFDVEHPSLDSMRVINYQCSFCMYNLFSTGDPEFLTDSTLVVSMGPDSQYGSDNWVIPMWEISLDGRIIRKLTYTDRPPFGPHSRVEDNATLGSTISVLPNPTTGVVSIQGEGIQAITVFNVDGNLLETATLNDGPREATIDLSSRPTGIYVLRIRTVGGAVIQKIVKR